MRFTSSLGLHVVGRFQRASCPAGLACAPIASAGLEDFTQRSPIASSPEYWQGGQLPIPPWTGRWWRANHRPVSSFPVPTDGELCLCILDQLL